MKPKCCIKTNRVFRGDTTEILSDAFDRHCADLLGLNFAVGIKPRFLGRNQYMKRQDIPDIRCHGRDRDRAEVGHHCPHVLYVITDDDRRANLSCFAGQRGLEVHQSDLTT